jgi:hypothetical protein
MLRLVSPPLFLQIPTPTHSHTHTHTHIQPKQQQRVWLALLEKQVKFEHKIVDLQEKPADFTALYSTLHPDPEARAKVPILEHGKEIKLIESMVCLCVYIHVYIMLKKIW